jgi:hypothetical protein
MNRAVSARAGSLTHATGVVDHPAALADTLRRQLEAARTRHEDLRARRQRLEAELQSARAAEAAADHTLEALRAVAAHVTGVDDPPEAEEIATAGIALAGRDLRDAIACVALLRNAHGDALHWRTWFSWLREDGFDAAGKRAEATFQTQLARSPLVRRTERDGIYVLDVTLLEHWRDEVLAHHERIAALPSADQLELIGDARTRRRELEKNLTRAERALEESWRTLTEALDQQWNPEHPPDTEQLVRLWRERRA